MKPEKIREEISRLELSEKLALVEDIWDSIADGAERVPVPDWQKEELDKRLRGYKEGMFELHAWEDVHNRLRKKYK